MKTLRSSPLACGNDDRADAPACQSLYRANGAGPDSIIEAAVSDFDVSVRACSRCGISPAPCREGLFRRPALNRLWRPLNAVPPTRRPDQRRSWPLRLTSSARRRFLRCASLAFLCASCALQSPALPAPQRAANHSWRPRRRRRRPGPGLGQRKLWQGALCLSGRFEWPGEAGVVAFHPKRQPSKRPIAQQIA